MREPSSSRTVAGAVALVTGGATGIGRETCIALARAGVAGVAVNYSSSADAAEQTVARLGELRCPAIAVRADVGDDEQARELVRTVVHRFGRIDFLVNNAGITRLVPFEDLDALTDEVWEEIMRVNLLGAFHCARAAAPELRRARGSIVNVSSVAAYRAVGSSLAYGVSKAAMLGLTRGLARSLAPEVRVNAVAPGTVTTGWHAALAGEEAAQAFAAEEAAAVPLRQVAGPEHVAQVVVDLLFTELVTGETLIVDGGKHVLY